MHTTPVQLGTHTPKICAVSGFIVLSMFARSPLGILRPGVFGVLGQQYPDICSILAPHHVHRQQCQEEPTVQSLRVTKWRRHDMESWTFKDLQLQPTLFRGSVRHPVGILVLFVILFLQYYCKNRSSDQWILSQSAYLQNMVKWTGTYLWSALKQSLMVDDETKKSTPISLASRISPSTISYS